MGTRERARQTVRPAAQRAPRPQPPPRAPPLPPLAPAGAPRPPPPPLFDHEALAAAVDLEALLPQPRRASRHILDRPHTPVGQPRHQAHLFVADPLRGELRDARPG